VRLKSTVFLAHSTSLLVAVVDTTSSLAGVEDLGKSEESMERIVYLESIFKLKLVDKAEEEEGEATSDWRLGKC